MARVWFRPDARCGGTDSMWRASHGAYGTDRYCCDAHRSYRFSHPVRDRSRWKYHARRECCRHGCQRRRHRSDHDHAGSVRSCLCPCHSGGERDGWHTEHKWQRRERACRLTQCAIIARQPDTERGYRRCCDEYAGAVNTQCATGIVTRCSLFRGPVAANTPA